ncbi:hypothetical protein Btru_072599 [Bulinus truncatus]|nr:hypothetical protein Btru_072599 [Bulinus truncatus]
MEIVVLIAAVVFTVSASTTKYGCTLDHVRPCPRYNSIAVPRFYPFEDNSGSDERCREIRTALQCTADIQQNCSRFDTLLFDTQRGVIDMICDSRKQDFIQSESCFRKDEVRDSVIKKCMSSIPPAQNLKNPCSHLLIAPTCARDVVFAVKGCSESDAVLLHDLVKAFLKPTVETFTCPGLADSFIPSTTLPKKPAEVLTTTQTTPGKNQTSETTTKPAIRVDLPNVLLQSDNQISLLLSALKPKIDISGSTGCRDGPIVQVNNFIFINSLRPNSTSHNAL